MLIFSKFTSICTQIEVKLGSLETERILSRFVALRLETHMWDLSAIQLMGRCYNIIFENKSLGFPRKCAKMSKPQIGYFRTLLAPITLIDLWGILAMETCGKWTQKKSSLVNHGKIIHNHRKAKKTNDNQPQDAKLDLTTSWGIMVQNECKSIWI